ncbi:hypothetical protein [Pontibacter fetidus]|uniref:Uncharacterized protein n=1 Tax=Pontibacter fetidus TaxID=2700082 RepID=A0A6B2H734_9BACT|nr:hypothetical protein [Pontibacter fetidus]NDK56696.1 hypothetical protein [Pontibacter fetidus]
MNITLINRFLKWSGKATALAIVCSTLLFACQSAEQPQEEANVATEQTAAAADTVQRRPAPDFYVIPPGMERKRVWVCDDASKDVFHTKNTCEALRPCNGAFRNVSLQRAIEEYGRYNCEICSKELSDIFDDKKIRG